MGMVLVQKHIVFLLVFVFSLNPQLSNSSSNVTLPNDSPLMLCHPLQSRALLQFISNFTIDSLASQYCDDGIFGGKSYPKTESWKDGTDCCSSWDGVTCDDVTGHVIGLDLSCSQLEGTIYSNNTLFSSHMSPHLQSLNLAENYFKGSEISSEFCIMFVPSLTHLNLSSSHFRGNIPSEISHLSNLVSLDLSYNGFDGLLSDRFFESIARNLTHLRVLNLGGLDLSSLHVSFLMNLSTSLTSLSLSDCHLQGEFPVSFLVSPNLEEIVLSYNNFNPVTSLPDLNCTFSSLLVLSLTNTTFSPSSSIALFDFAGNYLKSLNRLYLGRFNISGPIPASFGNLTQLTHLSLSYNYLTGSIPTFFSNLTRLTYLFLYGNELKGPIPTFISKLTHLTFLGMSDNELEGPLPFNLFALPSLHTVDLSNNKLYGQISISPKKYVNLAHLDLSNNSFSGSLDFDVFLSFNKLTTLDLSRNNISSSISASTQSNFTSSLPSFESLYLYGCNLSQFPTFIKALTNLTHLIVSNSKLQGPVPDWLYDVGKDTLYEVDLSGNSLTGVIGHQLAGWKTIVFIYFSSNLLQGSLPIIPTTVANFDVSKNNLSGVISSSICNLSSLQVFDLSYNQFTGPIPQCLVNMRNLWILNLGMNELHGIIPNTFPTDCNLSALVLKGNHLTGPIPSSLAHCKKLGVFDVGNNMIEGTFPHWLEKLRLRVLILRSNKFFGSLYNFKPAVLFLTLRVLDLSNNSFDGQVPMMLLKTLIALIKVDEKLEYYNQYMETGGNHYSMKITVKGLEREYVKIYATLSVIDLSRNKFEGSIPREIGKLVSLKGLNLSHNLLTGNISLSMGNLARLEWLDLSSNKLNGQIPNDLTSMTFLSTLNLSNNQLDGPIPKGKQFDTFTNDSYKNNLALCGLPLSKLCGSNHESPSDNKGSSVFNWAFAFAGYGCGIVLGVSMGYIVFETGKPKWFVRMVDGKKQRGRVGQRPKRSSGRRRS